MEGLECLRRRGGRLGRRGFRRFASRWAVDCGAHWARSGSGVNVLIEGSFGRDLPRIGASTPVECLQMPGIADATVYESSFASVGYITSPYIL